MRSPHHHAAPCAELAAPTGLEGARHRLRLAAVRLLLDSIAMRNARS